MRPPISYERQVAAALTDELVAARRISQYEGVALKRGLGVASAHPAQPQDRTSVDAIEELIADVAARIRSLDESLLRLRAAESAR